MSSCTFFGHRKSSDTLKPLLKNILVDLIQHKNVTVFYVGNHGNFDHMVRACLKDLKKDFPQITYLVVLAYMPTRSDSYENYNDTIIPEGLENTMPKYAILKRNRWMLDRADYVVANIDIPFGNAFKFTELAKKKGKTVINIGSMIKNIP